MAPLNEKGLKVEEIVSKKKKVEEIYGGRREWDPLQRAQRKHWKVYIGGVELSGVEDNPMRESIDGGIE